MAIGTMSSGQTPKRHLIPLFITTARPQIHGVRSFASLRSRATVQRVGGNVVWVAALSDIIASKRAAYRPRDRAVLEVLERTLHEEEALQARKA